MKALTVEKAQEIRAGKGHYHWICRDWANFVFCQALFPKKSVRIPCF